MAPMALCLLASVTGTDFRPWIQRGLDWIKGSNELGFDMENAAAGVVWRSIFRPSFRLRRYLKAAVGQEHDVGVESADNLKVLFECRPYELGWLLYASAGRVNRLSPRDSETHNLRFISSENQTAIGSILYRHGG